MQPPHAATPTPPFSPQPATHTHTSRSRGTGQWSQFGQHAARQHAQIAATMTVHHNQHALGLMMRHALKTWPVRTSAAAAAHAARFAWLHVARFVPLLLALCVLNLLARRNVDMIKHVSGWQGVDRTSSSWRAQLLGEGGGHCLIVPTLRFRWRRTLLRACLHTCARALCPACCVRSQTREVHKSEVRCACVLRRQRGGHAGAQHTPQRCAPRGCCVRAVRDSSTTTRCMSHPLCC
jgi:hypothetical protein